MKYKLSEIMDIIVGGTPKTNCSEYWNGNIPWLSVKDFNNDQRYVYETEKSITEAGLNNSSTRLLQKDDIIISARGTVGELAMIPYPMAFNQSCYGLRAKKDIVTPAFLYYLVKHNVEILKKNSHGSVFDTITRNTFDGIVVELPELEQQKKITGILENLDDKIHMNTEINKNLLAQADAIFSKAYEASTNSRPFISIINVLGGGTPKTNTPDYWNGSIPFFTPKDVGNPYTFHTEKYITDSGLKHCNSRLYPENTSFVTARGTVGKVSLSGVPMAMNQSCYALMSETVDPIMVYFYALKAVASLKHKASGAVFDAIVTRDFDAEVINVLNDSESHQVLEAITPMMKAIHNNAKESIELAALRDALLPHLMSGEIDVSDIDL